MVTLIPVVGYGLIQFDPATRIAEIWLYGAYAGRARFARSGTWTDVQKAAGLRRREVLLSALLAALPQVRAALLEHVRPRVAEAGPSYPGGGAS
jgi:hypothetical protein